MFKIYVLFTLVFPINANMFNSLHSKITQSQYYEPIELCSRSQNNATHRSTLFNPNLFSEQSPMSPNHIKKLIANGNKCGELSVLKESPNPHLDLQLVETGHDRVVRFALALDHLTTINKNETNYGKPPIDAICLQYFRCPYFQTHVAPPPNIYAQHPSRLVSHETTQQASNRYVHPHLDAKSHKEYLLKPTNGFALCVLLEHLKDDVYLLENLRVCEHM